MLQKVNNCVPAFTPNSNYLLMIAYKNVNPIESQEPGMTCRFDLFVRIRPGNPSPFPRQQRTWCYRGDKYTDQEPKMLRNLLNLVKNKIGLYDRVILRDNHKQGEEREMIKIVDDEICCNHLHLYSLMLGSYSLPKFLQ